MREEIFFTTLHVELHKHRFIDKLTNELKNCFHSRSFIFYTIKRKCRIIHYVWILFFTYPYSSCIFFLFFFFNNRFEVKMCYGKQINVHRAFENISIRGILSQIQIFIHAVSWKFYPPFFFCPFPAFAATTDLFTLGIA